MRVSNCLGVAALIIGAAVLTGCGGGGSSSTPASTSNAAGTLIFNPPLRVGSVTSADFTASLQTLPDGSPNTGGQQLLGLLQAAGMLPLPCGIDFHYIQYDTVGGTGEATTGSGALMVPTGGAGCSGKRPILLYSHGTAATRGYNMANPSDLTNEAARESGLIAAMFAAQGYIVVAPNYAGYDSSPLPYHPFLNANALSADMINALRAARSALGNIPAASTTDNGALFLSGYSEGGYVAMATHRAMDVATRGGATDLKVAAAAPMSGPYATEALGDAIVFGQAIDLAATVFFPLWSSGYQNSYHNLYNAPTDLFALPYANTVPTLMPGASTFTELAATGQVPLAFFDSTTPVTGNATLDAALAVPTSQPAASLVAAGFGFGKPYLVTNTFRLGYALDAAASPDGGLTVAGAPLAATPTYPFRQDLNLNDMRKGNWFPAAPTLMCGGANDPEVFYFDAQIMQAFWAPIAATIPGLPANFISALDVDSAIGANDPYAAVKAGFAAAKQADAAAAAAAAVAAGATDGGAAAAAKAVLEDYHGALVPPFCTLAARGYFKQVSGF